MTGGPGTKKENGTGVSVPRVNGRLRTRQRRGCTGESRVERGSRDHRLLPVAITLWTACLGTRWLFDVLLVPSDGSSPDGTMSAGTTGIVPSDAGNGSDAWGRWSGMPRIGTWTTGAWVAAAIVLSSIVCVVIILVSVRLAHAGIGRTTIMVCVMAALLGAIVTWSTLMNERYDPAAVRARESPGYTVVEGTVAEPVQVSTNREADCQAELRLRAIDDGSVRVRSHAAVRVFASDGECARIHRGAVYRVSGTFSEARFGGTPLWLTIHSEEGLTLMERQPWPERWREHMQESFFRATSGLSEQGRVLVPGLTMGFLGQDHLPAAYDARPINDAYATRLEERFRTAGIMHLMAVSGGHFVIVAGLVRRLCARLLVPRRIVAILLVASTTVLAALMAPGDSVSRALVMGWIGAAALYLGRRTQPLSALCVTVIIMLPLDPSLAWSYGFALSCSAVLGIVTMSGRVSGVLALLLPDRLAEAVAMTLAAQTATLPIQVMMEPELPLWSIPANVLVSPVVDFATMAGLAGLAVAWANVDAASLCAWIASWGTRVMEVVAMRLGGGDHAVVPWAGGVGGALLLAGVEAAVIIVVIRIARFLGPSRAVHALPGEPFAAANPRNRLRIWWNDTKRIIRHLDRYR